MDHVVYLIKSHRGLALKHLELIYGASKSKRELQRLLRKGSRARVIRFDRSDGLYHALPAKPSERKGSV